MTQKRSRLPREVERNGRTYAFSSIVNGSHLVTQTVTVFGIGTQVDTSSYGPGGESVRTMDAAARMIALEILKRAGK